jgi:hypothetical protein
MNVDIKIYLIHLRFLCSEEEGKVVSILTHFTLLIFIFRCPSNWSFSDLNSSMVGMRQLRGGYAKA